MKFAAFIVSILLPFCASAVSVYSMNENNAHNADCHGFSLERHYIAAHCHGEAEVVLADGSARVDCLTDTEAQEFEWAENWQEAIGQSLFYGMHSKKTPVVRLIVDPKRSSMMQEIKYAVRAKAVVDHYKLPIQFRNIVCGKPKI